MDGFDECNKESETLRNAQSQRERRLLSRLVYRRVSHLLPASHVIHLTDGIGKIQPGNEKRPSRLYKDTCIPVPKIKVKNKCVCDANFKIRVMKMEAPTLFHARTSIKNPSRTWSKNSQNPFKMTFGKKIGVERQYIKYKDDGKQWK